MKIIIEYVYLLFLFISSFRENQNIRKKFSALENCS
jgi:hypothetical protein